MHELSIANAILTAVQAEAGRHPGARLRRVGIRMGELAGVDPEALSFCFESLVKGTAFGPVGLHIETRPRQQRCPRCARTFAVVGYALGCPDCGELSTECVGGDELELAYLEVDEP